jgi:SAM-dependent methyltransferase
MRVIVEATRPVAVLSPDYIEPWGTRRDNSKNMRFNQKLYRLYPEKGILRVLDLGCSGGGFVKTCLDDGCLAIGLEGSDFSKKHRRAEWAIIPDFLFTCDVTADFDVFSEDDGGHREHLCFEVVTSWEMIEHIAESDLEIVAHNVKKHLSSGGLWIMSVATSEEVINNVRLHQTVRPRNWWIETFGRLGFEHLQPYVDYFNTQFVRGPKYGAAASFHLVLSLDKSQAHLLQFAATFDDPDFVSD